MEAFNQWLIDHRIACPEEGYPSSEARYADLEEYIEYLIQKVLESHERNRHG